MTVLWGLDLQSSQVQQPVVKVQKAAFRAPRGQMQGGAIVEERNAADAHAAPEPKGDLGPKAQPHGSCEAIPPHASPMRPALCTFTTGC